MRFAIMDIGYNAIRAVVYENNRLGAPEIFNNKFKNDILSLLTHESLEVKQQTYLSIQHLLHIFEKLKVTKIKCVATAILRNHPKAKEFVCYIKEKYKFDIDIISGEEEARLTAQGLISGIKDCSGIITDLGGGSLELAEVHNNKLGKLKSLALGTKVLGAKDIHNANEIVEIITSQFGIDTYKNLYLIGGSLRFLGRLYIEFTYYPIKNLHNLEIKSADFLKFIENTKTLASNEKNNFIKRKISNNAILVAEAMVRVFAPEKIIISTYGLKEGVRLELMDAKERSKDLIEERAAYASNCDLSKINFDSYFMILETIMPELKNFRQLIKLSIIMLPLRYQLDNTIPPKAIAEYILSSTIPFNHKTRILLALVLSYASNYAPTIELSKLSKRFILKEEDAICRIIAQFLQIADEIDGSVFSTPSFSIITKNNYLEIECNGILPRSIFENICLRLKSIAYSKWVYSQCS